jgi:vacuolar-type H+-ATPase subunit H
MATSTDYTDTLKKIKETEEEGAKELSARKKVLEEELRRLEEESARSIASAKAEAEEYVTHEVAKARVFAQADADRMLGSTTKEAEATGAKKLDKMALIKIVDAILAEFKEE